MTKSSKKSLAVKTQFQPVRRDCAGMEWSDEQLLGILADTINALRKQTAEGIIEIGFRLIEAKDLVGHGNWLPWLKKNFGWTDRTARNYMSVYELVSKSEIIFRFGFGPNHSYPTCRPAHAA